MPSPQDREWSLTSWRQCPIRQQPEYDDPAAVERALAVVRALPPLVSHGGVMALRAQMAEAVAGRAFLLQGGDCAERFDDCERNAIEAKLKVLLQMSLVLTWGARRPVIKVGRMAGQYAKPRSKDIEVVDGVELFSYRGDHVNAIEPNPDSRKPDPERLVRAYFHSAATLNYARALLDGGFAALERHEEWDLGFIRDPSREAEFAEIFDNIEHALQFMSATGIHGNGAHRRVDLYSSHEGLLLPYEEAQTLEVPDLGWFNLGAHMLWIGDRTRQIGGAHVEYFRGIENPIGIKVGPTMSPAELLELLDAVEPQNRPGRVCLIVRLGADRVESALPGLVDAVCARDKQVLWSSDPMHGNTVQTGGGLKTRDFGRVLSELMAVFDTLERHGAHLGGVHLELTGEDVTECTGGAQALSEGDLNRNYATLCDPRLNYGQSLDMALHIARRLMRGTAIE